METMADAAAAMEKAQAFAHRLVEFADYDKCVEFFIVRQIDFDRANDMGWSVLMSVCACGRDDLVGFVVDRTAAVNCATNTNRTTVLHLAAMSKNTRVMEELFATDERKLKLQKVLDQSNAHGDTAKNVKAVQVLLKLGANMDAVNASGMNALMCAARVGEDPRPGAPSMEEMMEGSAAIGEILLANGADVNAAEKGGGNTALHLAVLSENPDAVESLIRNAPDLDITLRNKSEMTALDLSKRISGVTSAQMENLLSSKWSQYEKEAAQMSAKVEKELMAMAVKEVEVASGRKQTAVAPKTAKKKSKKSKKNAKTSAQVVEEPSIKDAISHGELNGESTETSEADAADRTLPASGTTKARQEDGLPILEDDGGDWQRVIPKKTRRKELLSENVKDAPKRSTKKHQRKPVTSNKNNNIVQDPSKPDVVPRQTAQETCLQFSEEQKAPWGAHSASNPAASVSPRSQVTSEAEEDESITSSIPYDVLNGNFHRTFPVAAELEIDVEKFLIASSVSDRELEPNDNMSISQVEALQEAHWQAYHYLSEKKIELTRVLEAQRVEAQFALQQELMEMK